jgi:hypothetical protein
MSLQHEEGDGSEKELIIKNIIRVRRAALPVSRSDEVCWNVHGELCRAALAILFLGVTEVIHSG